MKRMITMMALAIAMMTLSVNTFAQTADKKQRMSREQLAEAQAKHIAHDLALDDATTQKFIKTFCDSQKDVWALGPRVHLRGTSSATSKVAFLAGARNSPFRLIPSPRCIRHAIYPLCPTVELLIYLRTAL